MKNMMDCYKKIQSDILNNYFKQDFTSYKYYIQKDVEEKTVYLASSCWIVKMPSICFGLSDETVTPMQKLKEIFQKAEKDNTKNVISIMSQDVDKTTHIILNAEDCTTHIDEKYRKLFPDSISYKITDNKIAPVTLYFGTEAIAIVFPLKVNED